MARTFQCHDTRFRHCPGLAGRHNTIGLTLQKYDGHISAQDSRGCLFIASGKLVRDSTHQLRSDFLAAVVSPGVSVEVGNRRQPHSAHGQVRILPVEFLASLVAIVELIGSLNTTRNCSSASKTESLMTDTVNVLSVSPGANVRLCSLLVKSDPASAVSAKVCAVITTVSSLAWSSVT